VVLTVPEVLVAQLTQLGLVVLEDQKHLYCLLYQLVLVDPVDLVVQLRQWLLCQLVLVVLEVQLLQ
jgi:hypothetical protein